MNTLEMITELGPIHRMIVLGTEDLATCKWKMCHVTIENLWQRKEERNRDSNRTKCVFPFTVTGKDKSQNTYQLSDCVIHGGEHKQRTNENI